MDIKNKVEVTLKNYEGCLFICNADMPLGKGFDFSCALTAFFADRLKQAHEAQVKAQADQKALEEAPQEQPKQV